MAQLNYTVDNSNMFESKGFELLPAGNYKVVIDDSDAYNNDKENTIVKLVFQIIEGQFNGRKLFDYLVVDQPVEEYAKIAQAKLNKICAVINVKEMTDTVVMHNKPLVIRVGIKRDKKDYTDKNVIYDYMGVNGNSQQPQVAPPQSETNKTGQPSFLRK